MTKRFLAVFVVSASLFAALLFPAMVGAGLIGPDQTKPAAAPVGAAQRLPQAVGTLDFTVSYTVFLPIMIGAGTTNPPAGAVEITALVYEGSDEYVQITNNGAGAQLLDGWTIFSVEGSQTYDFPAGINLGVGQSVRVHSGSGASDNPPNDLLWSGAFIWNNAGDKAELKDDQGTVVDSFCYGDGC